MNSTSFETVLLLLGVAVVFVALFRYLQLPQVLAYLCAGILIGPHGLGWIADTEDTRYLAEFGLVFLMFTIGLEFSLAKLMQMKAIVFGLGGAQVLLTGLAFGFAVWWLGGVSPEGAIAIGGILAMSSTAIVGKLLVEQLEQNSRHGRHAVAVLLFQDLVVVVLLILIPALAGDGPRAAVPTVAWVLVKSAAVFALMVVAGRWIMRPLFHRVAAVRMREFFMLTVLLMTLAAAWLTETAGLSLALGSFLAGMMLGETEYRHQVESDIMPFRDILLGLFFVTVGMLLDVGAALAWWPWILALVAAILVFKTLLILALGKLFGMETGVALRTGLVLSQVGEFGFALLLQARQFELIGVEADQIVLAAIVITMLVAPLIVRHNGRWARRWVPEYHRVRAANLDAIRAAARANQAHVIICGYGRSGQNLAWMLEQERIGSFALDLDPERVRDARDADKPVMYGDAARRDVLEAAGLERAAALAVSFNDLAGALKILEVVRNVRPELPVIVRTMDDSALDQLMQAGATEVVPESLEGSLMMGSHVLLLLGVPGERITGHVREVRRDRYRMLRGSFRGMGLSEDERNDADVERLHSITLTTDAFAVGKCLADLALDGATVTAVRRGTTQTKVFASDAPLASGDVIMLYGRPEVLERAERALTKGRQTEG